MEKLGPVLEILAAARGECEGQRQRQRQARQILALAAAGELVLTSYSLGMISIYILCISFGDKSINCRSVNHSENCFLP